MVTVLVLAAVTAVVCSNLLFRAALEAKLATRSQFQSVALNLAEAAIEEGLFALNTGNINGANGWALAEGSATDFVKTVAGLNLAQATGEMRVRLDAPAGNAPVIVATGVVRIPQQPDIIKQVRVGAALRRPWSNGMVAKERITFMGVCSVDSFDSAVGPYNSATNRSDKVTVASVSTATNAVEISNKSTVYGFVATGGSDPLAPFARIYGATSPCPQPPPPPYIDPTRVRRDFVTNLPLIVAPSTNPATVNVYDLGAWAIPGGTTTSLPRLTDTPIRPAEPPSPTNPYRYAATSLAVDASGNLDITGPVEIVVSGTTTVAANGFLNIQNLEAARLNFYAGGNVTMAGWRNYQTGTAACTKATLFGTNPTSQTISISGSTAFLGTIYAPFGALSLSVLSPVYGAVVANTITLAGWGRFAWDTQLANVELNGFGYRVTAWAELTAQPGSGHAFARDNRVPFASLF